MMLTPNTV